MAKKIKIPFAQIQKITMTTLCILCTLLSWSCINIGDPNLPEPLSDEQISINLSENGKSDPELLIGEWDAIKFAYTADGHKISDVVNITSAQLVIPVVPTDSECEVFDPKIGSFKSSVQWGLKSINGSGWLCSISRNSIKVTCCGYTKRGVPCPHEEWDIFTAFYNAYSFVINGNELMIYFTENKDRFFGDAAKRCSIAGEKKMNLIIFKKR